MNQPTDAGAASASARWRLVQEVLADAIECPPAERRALLDRRCHDDTGLRHEVESLLAAHDGDGAVDRLASLVKAPNAWIREPITGWAGRRTLHYHIEAQLGEGGMGVVYRARDERLGRQVALKFLPPHMSADADAKARFVAEARAAAALDHPNVCAIYEIGETDDGQLFIAMPFYEGETLQARLDRGRLTFGDALPILTQVACGLSHAHEYGIVHRDVKPSNIVVLADGTAKVLDFGIAKVHDAAFNDRHLVGTIAYMSPEQASGGIVDARSDVWSLAIVAHEMLSGRRPFRGDDGQSVLDAILGGEPELTATTYPDVPAGVDAILRRALSKRSDQRYASTSLLAAELAALSSQPADAAGTAAARPRRAGHVVVNRTPARGGAGHGGVRLRGAGGPEHAGRSAAADRVGARCRCRCGA